MEIKQFYLKICLIISLLVIFAFCIYFVYTPEINYSDYIHLSGNNNIEDTNISLLQDDLLLDFLNNSNDLNNKKFTLEVYSGDSDLRQSFDYLNSYTNS